MTNQKYTLIATVPLLDWLDYLRENGLRVVKYKWHKGELCALTEKKGETKCCHEPNAIK